MHQNEHYAWCSPRDQSRGLEAPRRQKIKSWCWSWSWQKKSWEFSRLLWVWIIAGTKNNNSGRDWVLVLFSTVLSQLLYIRPTIFIMRPSSLGGGRILRRTLSVRLSVRPSRYRCHSNIGHVLSSTLRTCGIFCFVYMSGPHIVRRSQTHKLVSYTAMRVVCILFCSFCYHDMVTCSVIRVKSWSWSWSCRKIRGHGLK